MKFLGWTLMSLVAIVLGFLLVFPYVAKPNRGPDARLLDAKGGRLAFTSVMARDATGRPTGEFRSDSQGNVRFDVATRKEGVPQIDGFTMTRRVRATGGYPGVSYEYTIRATSPR